ncbi:MAG: YcaO-like family protein [Candidatus Levybacteria bacterium]|nr:YcaO-like family protein [Candidatus Levybacteria bacterium]
MIYFHNAKSEELYKSILNFFPHITKFISRVANDYNVLILDDVRDGDFLEKYLNLNNKGIFFIYKKDDYLFFGPILKSIFDACPYCLLLTLASDENSVDALKRKNRIININRKINPKIKTIEKFITTIDLSTGQVLYLKIPMSHPACSHFFNKKNTKVIRKTNLSTNKIIKDIYDSDVGIIRELKSLKDISSKKFVKKMGKNEVIFSWFQNPIFSFYPEVRFLDLAIGSAMSYKSALKRALFESIERYSVSSFPHTSPDYIGMYTDIKENAINPEAFWRYSDEQIKNPGFIFKNPTSKNILNWRYAYDLKGKKTLIPEDYLYINLKKPSRFHNNSTSGSAAQVNFNKACLNGLLEMVERDNIMYHWVKGNPMSHLKLSGMSSKILENISFLDGLRFEVKIIDVSRFNGLFTFIILLVNKKNKRPKVVLASACHYDPEEAILKTFREAVGSLLISIFMEEKNGPNVLSREDVKDPEDHAIFYREPSNIKFLDHYIQASDASSIKSFKQVFSENENILEQITNRLSDLGINVYFYDLTLPNMMKYSLSVVRTISPELLPIMFGSSYLKLSRGFGKKFEYSKIALQIPHPYS